MRNRSDRGLGFSRALIIYYVLMTFNSVPSFPLELARIFRITDGVMRSLVVCKDED